MHGCGRHKTADATEARIPGAIVNALRAPDLEAVVICPSNRYHTVRPILETGGIKDLLRKQGAPVIAISPIVGGSALRGSAAKMMTELGHEVLPRTVAMEYYKLIDGFVIDQIDAEQAEGLARERHRSADRPNDHAHAERPR